jgi:lipopolysaccharide export LptBFGC system permease protein LptF
MGILVAFAGFAQRNELVAMKAAGVPMKRVVVPVILMGAALSGVCFLAQDQLQPWAVRRVIQLIYSDLPLRASLDMLPPGVMHNFGGWRIYIGEKADGSDTLRDIVILQPDGDDGTSAFYADEARLERRAEGSVVVLHNGFWIQSRSGNRVMHAASPRIELPAPRPEPKETRGEREGLSLRELLAEERELARLLAEHENIPTRRDLFYMRAEIANRVAFPLMCLALSVIAAPLAARSRRSGRSYVFAGGFAVLVAYFVLRSMAAPRDVLPLPLTIAMGMTPNLAMLTAGLVLIWRVDRV